MDVFQSIFFASVSSDIFKFFNKGLFEIAAEICFVFPRFFPFKQQISFSKSMHYCVTDLRCVTIKERNNVTQDEKYNFLVSIFGLEV